MSKKLPEKIVEELNSAGLGGRLVYVPLRNKARTISDSIYETMIGRLKAGAGIDFDQFQNMVSLRTLYRLKAKAIEEVTISKEKDSQTNRLITKEE